MKFRPLSFSGSLSQKIRQNGVNFHEFACLARCNGLDVKKFQANRSSRDHFLQTIKDTCSTTDKIVVLAYSRKALQQTGDGHYSPIGGYDPETNTALVMDVARFKVRPILFSFSFLSSFFFFCG